jgi:hypothetical protein
MMVREIIAVYCENNKKYVCIYIHVYICIYVCIYIYVYICIYTHCVCKMQNYFM